MLSYEYTVLSIVRIVLQASMKNPFRNSELKNYKLLIYEAENMFAERLLVKVEVISCTIAKFELLNFARVG